MIEIVQVVCSDHAFGHEIPGFNKIIQKRKGKYKQKHNSINFTDNIYNEKAIYTPIPGINMRCYRFMF